MKSSPQAIFFVGSHRARNYLPVGEVVAAVLGFGIAFGAIVGHHGNYLWLIMYSMDKGDVFS